MTNVFQKLKDANLTVVVHNLKNEYTTLAFDYWSDPDVKIATYIQTAKVDGIVTDFLATASRFMRSPMILPGDLLNTIPTELQPPALPPLKVAKVVNRGLSIVAILVFAMLFAGH
ncbi:hypothetical protein AAZX31_18G063700 [Glycine max]|uniref:glycerophosphodiester phosphodiesterase GDPDL6 n=1 Tax=Glycine max TaxID=3847 RepID=UPI00023DA446|nr:glycerophosphodiester phosphodiesterase GDPDL6-like [Glycine max]KAG4377220.1 hypothetical protein GLYMA_18G064851v4 [Glycine max]KAH1153492.1 hypothetical protein GYH30_049226 [Glycine max]KAH1197044.1 Glycerophosphodiester phosphodiesterase GDPDL6 [Glycine max]|eukprot:XP_014626607.1 glycerophosphodiester phosphodiesterase GDPDL6-like [Glycine max]